MATTVETNYTAKCVCLCVRMQYVFENVDISFCLYQYMLEVIQVGASSERTLQTALLI